MIDEDQGESHPSADNRPGFRRPPAEIFLGHVGLALGRETSRLVRSCKDWYRPLELCGPSHVLLADAGEVCDPAELDDRLPLGLKGTAGEAELHVSETRTHHGRLNVASRGEFFTCVPVGYVKRPGGGTALDPDKQGRSAVPLLPAKFAGPGTASEFHAYLVANDIRAGRRADKGPDEVAAYIGRDGYQANRRRLRESASDRGPNRTTGRAPTLLDGSVRCGRCGNPMTAPSAQADAVPWHTRDAARYESGAPRARARPPRSGDWSNPRFSRPSSRRRWNPASGRPGRSPRPWIPKGPSRGRTLTAAGIRRTAVGWGRTGSPPGTGGPTGWPGPGGWWPPAPARGLGVTPAVVRQWRWYGGPREATAGDGRSGDRAGRP